jgi:NNP family nitrate/nitrite transporter-like MFS transporter
LGHFSRQRVDGILNHTDSQIHEVANHVVPFRDRLTPILVLCGIFLFNFLARFIWGPLLPNIEEELGIQHTKSGSLFLMITIGYFIGLFVSGYLSARFNHHKTVVISCFSCGLALLAAMMAPSLIYLEVALIGIGLTAGLYLPSGIASVTYRLDPKDFGKAFSFHEISPSLGFIVSPLLAEALLGWGSWRVVLWPSALGLFAFGLFNSFRSSTGGYRGEPPTVKNLQFVASNPAFWLMLILFILGVGANPGVYSMLPLYLQAERGMDQTYTNLALSASRIAAMLSPFVAGWATHRFGARPVLAVNMFLTGIATVMLGLALNNWLWLPLFLQPMLSTAFFPPAYTILTGIVPSSYRNLIVALIMPAGILLGVGALPTMIGAFGDAGMFHEGFTVTGLLVTASTALLWFIRT